MISFMIEDTKECMQKLLKEDVFDDFLCMGFELVHLYKVTVDGDLRTEALDTDEKDQLNGRQYIYWKTFKPHAFEMIKGHKTPSSLKLAFALSDTAVAATLNRVKDADDSMIQGFNFTLTFEKNRVKIITGTNYATFTLNKTAEQYFDDSMFKFFKKHGMTPLLALD